MSSKRKSEQDGGRKPVYLVLGGDEFAVSAKARAIVDELCPPAEQAFGLERIDGSPSKADEAVETIRKCMDAVMTVGFLGAGKTVWLENASFLSEGDPGRIERVKHELERLTDLIKNGLPPGQHLVVSSPAVSRRMAFYKACEKAGEVHAFEIESRPWQAVKDAQGRLAELLREKNLKMPQAVAEAFLERTGYDTRQMAMEIEKLAVSCGEGASVTADHVRLLVSPGREAPVFELTEHVGMRNLPAALKSLKNLQAQKLNAMAIIYPLQSHIRMLALIRDCLNRRWCRAKAGYGESPWSENPEEDAVLSRLGKDDPRKMHSFRVQKLAEQCAYWTDRELARALRQIVKTHERLVSSPVSSELLMELLIVALCAKSGKRGAVFG